MKKRKKFLFVIVFFVLDLIILKCYLGATEILISKGESEFQASMSSAVYDALGDELLDSFKFNDIFTIYYNDNKEITFISTDSFKVNLLAKNLAQKTLKYFQNYCSKGVDVPLGAFTGLKMLSGVGKNVNIKLLNVTSVKCEFVSSFESAGINQTRQTLYLNVTPDLTVVALGKKSFSCQSMSVLVYDNLIVGKVPATYLNAQIIGESG